LRAAFNFFLRQSVAFLDAKFKDWVAQAVDRKPPQATLSGDIETLCKTPPLV
jgi:hypothetical protein